MKIIDNFLSKTYFKTISELVSGPDFEWSHLNITYNKRTDYPEPPHLNDYGFSYCFWHEKFGLRKTTHSHFIVPLLYQILDVTDCDFILRARADMVTWSKEDHIYPAHTDFPFPHTASVFYINESDGDTIFYNVKPEDVPKDKNYKDLEEYDRVSPIPNRLVIFDGELLHTGCSPTKHKNRILINSNYIKKEIAEKVQMKEEIEYY